MKKTLKLKKRTNNGITLIALVITIIVLLILAGVSIATLTGENGILTQANKAKEETAKAEAQEAVQLAVMSLQAEMKTKEMTQDERKIELEKELQKIDEDAYVELNGKECFVTYKGYEFKVTEDLAVVEITGWDDKAAPEDIFIWKSDDPTSPNYGVVIGYTSNIGNYLTLRYPTRCTEIQFADELKDYSGIDIATSRSFTNTIVEIEIPVTVKNIGASAFGPRIGSSFSSVKKITIEGETNIESEAFYNLR